jgi:hypothetical protein
VDSGSIHDLTGIRQVTIKGDILGGGGTGSGSISVDGTLGVLTVGGTLVGTSTQPVVISAVGQIDLLNGAHRTISRVTVGGRVEFAQILAGISGDPVTVALNGLIGSVTVGGDWIASSISAGIDPKNGQFGDGDDLVFAQANPLVVSQIGSIRIGGTVMGTPGNVSATDSFGFEAQQIGAVTISGVRMALQAGAHNDTRVPLGATADLFLREF